MPAIVMIILAFVAGQIIKSMKKVERNRPGQMPPINRQRNLEQEMAGNFPDDTARQAMEAFGRAFSREYEEEDEDGEGTVSEYDPQMRSGSLTPPEEEYTRSGSLPPREGEDIASFRAWFGAPAESKPRYTKPAPAASATTTRQYSKNTQARDAQAGTVSIRGVSMNAEQLRNAVIMAEIIGPPKSRRRAPVRAGKG